MENKLKKQKKVRKPTKRRSVGRLSSAIRGILGSDTLTESTYRQFPFVLYLALLALIYIGNNYLVERNIRRISALNKEIKEIKYEYISTKSRLMQLSKQSQVAKRVAATGLKESTEPVTVIRTNEKNFK